MCEFMASKGHVSIMKTREVLRCCIAYWSSFLSKENHYWKHLFGHAGKLCLSPQLGGFKPDVILQKEVPFRNGIY